MPKQTEKTKGPAETPAFKPPSKEQCEKLYGPFVKGDSIVSEAALRSLRAAARRRVRVSVLEEHANRLAKCADKFYLPDEVVLDGVFTAFLEALETEDCLPFPIRVRILFPGE